MNKGPILFICILLSLSLVSAHGSYYEDNFEKIYVEKNGLLIPVNNHQENYMNGDKRYPVHDYRYGYTYRDSKEYRSHHRDEEANFRNRNIFLDARDKFIINNPDSYYKHSQIKDSYTEIKCYHKPPVDKWIYRKCPEIILVE